MGDIAMAREIYRNLLSLHSVEWRSEIDRIFANIQFIGIKLNLINILFICCIFIIVTFWIIKLDISTIFDRIALKLKCIYVLITEAKIQVMKHQLKSLET